MGLVLFQKHKLHFIKKNIVFKCNIIKMLSYITKTNLEYWVSHFIIHSTNSFEKCRQMLAHVLLSLIHLRKERAGILADASLILFVLKQHVPILSQVIFVQCHWVSSGSKHWLSGSVKRYISLICSSIQRNAPSQCLLRLFWILFFSHLPLTSQVLICGTLLLQSWC